MKARRLRYCLCAALTAMLLTVMCAACGGFTAYAESGAAADNISWKCTYKSSNSNGYFGALTDGRLYDVFAIEAPGKQYLSINLNGRKAQCLYIKWSESSPGWTLRATLSDGTTLDSVWGKHGYLQEYVPLPEDTVSLRMITSDGAAKPMRIFEIEVYSPGSLPERVHQWEPTPTTAELMVISTHQDDELLFLGGTLPYYSGELDYDTVTVYATFDRAQRLHEALEGLWVCGATQYPVFLDYPDYYCKSMYAAEFEWDRADVTRRLTELIVKHRPQVIVTQDENGEYGHGQHILLVDIVKTALLRSTNSDYLDANFNGLEPWPVPKCYLHLYGTNKIVMPWDTMTLESLGGRTALQVAKDAYQKHTSQLKFDFFVGAGESIYDCRLFGLYKSNVGADAAKNDFFENITLRYRHVKPPESALPEYLSRRGSTGWLYENLNAAEGEPRYLRYCEVGSAAGWYAADQSGCLLEPNRAVTLFTDSQLDLSGFETLTLIGDQPDHYSYYDGIALSAVIVRYGRYENNAAAFYLADSFGELITPITPITVSTELPERTQPEIIISDGDIGDEGFSCSFGALGQLSLIACVCVMLIATAVTLMIITLQLQRKKRRAARRRPRDRRGGRRYRR